MNKADQLLQEGFDILLSKCKALMTRLMFSPADTWKFEVSDWDIILIALTHYFNTGRNMIKGTELRVYSVKDSANKVACPLTISVRSKVAHISLEDGRVISLSEQDILRICNMFKLDGK